MDFAAAHIYVQNFHLTFIYNVLLFLKKKIPMATELQNFILILHSTFYNVQINVHSRLPALCRSTIFSIIADALQVCSEKYCPSFREIDIIIRYYPLTVNLNCPTKILDLALVSLLSILLALYLLGSMLDISTSPGCSRW